MKSKRKLLYSLLVAVIVVTVALVITMFSVITNSLVESQTLNTLKELATHDKNTISMFINYNWENLRRIGKRLNISKNDITTQDDINTFIVNEENFTTFDTIYLLNTDGTYFTNDGLVSQSDQTLFCDFLQYFKEDSPRTIQYLQLPEISDKMLVYGYKMNNDLSDAHLSHVTDANLASKEIFAAIGICHRSSLETGIIVDSFVDTEGHGRGHCSVIDPAGNFIINIHNNETDAGENWLTHLAECKNPGLPVEEIKQNISERKTFSFYHQDGIEDELYYCTPLSDRTDWYFMMAVNTVALQEQTSPFVWMIVAALGITLLVLVSAMLILVHMQRKTNRAIAQEKAQHEFLSNMSHEIRTPLNGLIGLNYLMLTSIDDPDKKDQMKEWLAKSHSTANYLLSLINDVLDVSKLRAGKIEIAREPIDLSSLVEAIYSMQYDNIISRGIRFEKDFNITVPCIYGDTVRLKQVLINVLGNAAKFTPADGLIKVSVKQTMTDSNHVDSVFTCEDTGCGMSKDFLFKIFDFFEQERNSNNESQKGTGLGMPISKLLLEAMGGNISVASELGKGTKFTITLPAEICKNASYAKQNTDAKEELPATQEEKKLKVLVAEDNELNAEILIEILEEVGFVVTHAKDGGEAVKMFEESQENEFGIILMDMRMPVLDGCGAAKTIRSLSRTDAKTVPIFACTANTFAEDKEKAFESGMNDFLAKPIDVKILLDKMESLNIIDGDDTGENSDTENSDNNSNAATAGNNDGNTKHNPAATQENTGNEENKENTQQDKKEE